MARVVSGCLMAAAACVVGLVAGAPARASDVIAQFQGGSSSQSAFVPPDMGGGVGGGYVVQLLNGVATIDTTAGAQVSQTTLNSFFGGISTQLSDPRVIFDPNSQRWFASAITVPGGISSNPNSILLAVSAGASPTSGFTTLSFSSSNSNFADYPTLGVNNAAVTIGTNDFSTSTGNYVASSLYSVPKSSLTVATPSLTNMTSFADNTSQIGFTPQAVTNPAAGGTSTSVLSTGVDQTGNQVYALSTVAGANAAGAGLSLNALLSQPFNTSTLVFPTQPGGTSYDPGDTRISSGAYQAGNNIYFANTVSNGTSDQIAWNVLNATTNGLTTGLISIAGLNLTYGSISANANGTFVVSFNGSGSSQNITDYYVICSSITDSCGTPQVALISSNNNYNITAGGRNRWGDYSWTTVDPSNPNNFWLFQEYASTITVNNTPTSTWATVITEIGTATSTAAPEPDAVSLLAVGLVGLVALRRRRRTG